MKRRILFIILFFLATVAVMAVQKPLFMWFNAALYTDVSVVDWFRVLLHGLHLDCSVAGYLTVLPVMIVAVSVWVPRKWWRKVLLWYFALVAVLVSVIFSADLGLYENWGYRIDRSVLFYLQTPRDAVASITAVQAIAHCAIALAYGALMFVVYRSVLRILGEVAAVKHRVAGCAVSLILVCLLIIPIRGGFDVAVANVSSVYFSDNMVLNHAAVNPVFSLASSLGNKEELTDRYEFLSDDELDRQCELLRPCLTPQQQVLDTVRPNIVLVIVESFGRTLTDEVVDGRAVSPNFERLKSQGVWFENMYANSFRTDRGLVSILSGFPSQPTMSIMKNPIKSRRLPSLAGRLDSLGYVSSFTYGGDLNFTNTASYLYNMGFNELTEQKNLHVDAPTSKWGYADDVVCDVFASQVEAKYEAGKPFFAVLLTLSSHEPFDVPTDEFSDKLLNSVYFTDSCLGELVGRLSLNEGWRNTLLVFVADHAYRYPYGISNSAPERYRIPMLWLGGAVREPLAVDTYCSQMDIAPTVLSQMGVAASEFTFGRNVFAPCNHFGYYTYNDGVGFVTDSTSTVIDCTSHEVVSADSLNKKSAEAIVQQTYRVIRAM